MALPAKPVLFGVLFVLEAAFFIGWLRSRKTYVGRKTPRTGEGILGFIVSFFDTLGIGSFAPTAAALKFLRWVPDEQIPGTLNVGTNVSAMLEMIIMVTAIEIDPLLLMSTVLAAACGAWLGAGIVNRLPRAGIQLVMGIALFIAACLFVATNLHLMPGGGVATTLTGWRLILAVVINFVLGALMSAGIGLYAPCMIAVTLLGLSPRAAFPIMMGACGMVQPTASLQFFRSGRYAFGTCVAFVLGGVPAVLLAAWVVRDLNLTALRWLVVVAVAYASISMLRSFWSERSRTPLAVA